MRLLHRRFASHVASCLLSQLLFLLPLPAPMWGQCQTSAVPRMVSYSGVLRDAGGHAVTGLAGVAPLWLETQSVKPDASGHYTMQLGFGERARTSVRVFMSGEGRWLAVWIGSEAVAAARAAGGCALCDEGRRRGNCRRAAPSAFAHPYFLARQQPIKLLCFQPVLQTLFLYLSRSLVKDRNLLKPRMKIQPIISMTLAPLGEPWSCLSQPNLLAATSQRRYAIKRLYRARIVNWRNIPVTLIDPERGFAARNSSAIMPAKL